MGLARTYLIAYNGAQLGIWGLTLAKVLIHLAKGGKITELYSTVRSLVRAGLGGALLEILHAYTKIVKSPVATTAVQCIVRAFVVVGAVEASAVPNASSQSVWCGQMVSAWAVSETIRYGYYFSNLLTGKSPSILTWLRYSAFLLLYPIGIAGEMGCFVSALPGLRESGKWSISMPNRMNFSFSYTAAVWTALLGLYPVGGWSLYSYMLKQRKKQLSKE